MTLKLDWGLAALLGSIVVHAEELADNRHTDAGDFDEMALRGALQNDCVQNWLNSFPPGVLPVRREKS